MARQGPVDRANDWIVERPGRVVLVFLVLTFVFAGGLGNVETAAGTEQFTEELPAEQALQQIDSEFGPSFAAGSGSTQLIQVEENVLSRGSLLRMLRAQHRLEEADDLRVTETSSAASIVARTVDPSATTREDEIRTIERATPREIDAAVRRSASRPGFTSLLGNDFNERSASASATIAVVTHSIPAGLEAGAGTGGTSPLTPIQRQAEHVVDTVGGDIRVFGTGIFADEFTNVIFDSLLLVIPAAVIFIVTFLVIAYRDPIDLLLGIGALGMTIVWTFGFMGLAGIPFNQMLIAVPPLLLAVGIDFGIHAVNRYREERVEGFAVEPAMRQTGEQLIVAFFIVTGSTVIGFSANFSSALAPIRDFGLVASIGILFTFLIFGVFLPASKVAVDRFRVRSIVPTFSERPLGSEGSPLGRVLNLSAGASRRAPAAFLLVVLLFATASGVYARDIDTSFSQEDFLPPADTPDYLEQLPEPFAPSEYSAIATLDLLEERFAASQQDSVTVYVEGPMERDHALEAVHRAGRDPPDSFVGDERHASSDSIVDVIRSQANRDPEFARLVERNDRNGNGIPDDDLGEVYDALFASAAAEEASNYLADDRRATRVVYSVKSDADQAEIAADGRAVADHHRFEATATGQIVVFGAVSDLIFRSALQSLAIALVLTAVFLLVIYRVLEGWASLGVANLVPIVVTVAALAGTMRAVGIPFNAFTATTLAITIGLGVDYSVHVTHRFADEYRERDLYSALDRTVRGTGGALTGSMLTTTFGIGVLVLAVFPAIGQFGLVTALSILYSYLASLIVLPPTLVVWARWIE